MPNYNLMAPFGNAGPQYDLRPWDTGTSPTINSWNAPQVNPWVQQPNPQATWNANQQAKTAGGGGGSGVVPVISPTTGLYVDPNTGQPFTGADPSGKTYQGGQPSGVPVPFSPGKTINPNDPTQRYNPVNIVKSPEVAGATAGLMDTFTKTASSALDDFSKYLSTFKDQISGAATKSAAATNIGPVSNTLRGYQTQYANALDRSAGQYQDLNQRTAANEMGIVKQAQDLIPSYDEATNRAEALAIGNADRIENAGLSTGAAYKNPGSYAARLALANAGNIAVPLEQAKINKRYDVLSQFAMPATLDVANRETARVANFDPMVAAQQFQSGQATEQTIQGLAMTTANMSYDNAMKYMQSLGVPIELQQRILSGEIGQLSGLNQLYTGSRYQGLQDTLGANITPTVSYNMGVPGYRGPTRSASGPQYPGLSGANAPVVVGGAMYPGSALGGRGVDYAAPIPDYSNYAGYEVANPQDVAQVNYA